MNKIKIKEMLPKTDFAELTAIQIYSWELSLKKQKLKEATVDRKIKNILDFFLHLNNIKVKNKRIKFSSLNKILFEYVRDGYFGVGENLDNCGTSPYRQNIYYNIEQGLNYIYEDMQDNRIINPLTSQQKEILNDISKNNWFKVCTTKNDESETFYDGLQVQLIEKLGIKVYFDKDNLLYVLSHELSELIGKQNKDVMKNLRLINSRLQERNFSPLSNMSNFTMIEDTYKTSVNNGAEKELLTYKIYKDLLLIYLIGLNGDKFFDFKLQYIDAFNYIEQQYNKMLIENGKLKESFYNMYNEIRKRNRDLLIDNNNKKVKKKTA